MRSVRSDRIFLGMEAEPAARGEGLAILEDDRVGYDYWIGAVHYLTGEPGARIEKREAERQFLRHTRQLVDGGIDILAHPFRYFPRTQKVPAPRDLYRPVAEMLQERAVAAELNFHTNNPDPEFFAMCMEMGVKISLGSDAHSLVEVGALLPHIELLREIDALKRLEDVLWYPRGMKRMGSGE